MIAVGTSLASHSADAGRLYPNAKLLHIDTHPIIYQQGRVAAHHHLCADAKIGVDAIFLVGVKTKEQLEKISNVMKDVGLDDSLIFKYPHEFSGGQRQRIAIARSIILNPKFMILDEPTSALDRSIQIQVIDVLKRLQDKYKLTYLFISHDLKVIRSMCDQIFVMSEGKLVEYGKADEVFENPKQEYTQKLLRAALKYSSN